jgi:hypothetical protein
VLRLDAELVEYNLAAAVALIKISLAAPCRKEP